MSQPDTSNQAEDIVRQTVDRYGDLLFDLCATVLWSQSNARAAIRVIIREIKKSRPANKYVLNERAWVFHIAYKHLMKMAKKLGRRLTPSEQIMLDAGLPPEARLSRFDSYFHRLPAESQALLLMKDKYGFDFKEIAAIMSCPLDSVRLQRQQALGALAGLIWSNK
ncbi:MAG: hypothetical protein A2583_00395 [Bdellovibrionales bacterium RIFOXYD1_FULL_53_11]|nr:MAG: hypothetical protein A2583_00395 [Bdellovibrionales bacterium RIFOXYD1_FULL_53_11]